ncbi:hypothetical protein [Streptomyces sp. NPDC002082]|uniref:hypothetical protein n=1 Tax=Streptomyces sp. NPDC002082 TaxID=3154772 RepID=UPI00332C2314
MALPIHLADTHWEELHPPLLEAGSYAVDPAPYGPPWRQWDEVGAGENAARGRFVPFGGPADGPADTGRRNGRRWCRGRVSRPGGR